MTIEASARVKINELLTKSGWRFFADGDQPANIRLEPAIDIHADDLQAMGRDFEHAKRGYVDFLLLDSHGFPLVVLEAKAESKNPLVGKEQARRYARSLNCRFVILSNGNLHYFWDLDRGDPIIVTNLPTPHSVENYYGNQPNPSKLTDEIVESDYIVLTQRPRYQREAAWRNTEERTNFIKANNLRFLRPYQLRAVHSVQKAVRDGDTRFLFEMATGTGKTLTAAAICKLFLRTGNAHRVLFLVDRLELEEQAASVFMATLSSDYQTEVLKVTKENWRRAEIVVSTTQSLLYNNKYLSLFSPTDFDLVISDEAHRTLGRNSRAIFDYFVGCKLGLTATPRNYLRKNDGSEGVFKDPRIIERRMLLDTYHTFGCAGGDATFSYSLSEGVKDGYLVHPRVVDARTDVSTELLSKEGFMVNFTDGEGVEEQEVFKQTEFERRFFSQRTNEVLCATFLEHALRDPISGEVGKSIIFAVNQEHASKLTQILNVFARELFPDKYESDFAVQVTSSVNNSALLARQFANNTLLGSGAFVDGYKTCKARVCVTVGMMSTGYDCTDILNIGLFRPIFSPTEFVQIKGRGTRRHRFSDQMTDDSVVLQLDQVEKKTFQIFDCFATFEYFEEHFKYDHVIPLPGLSGGGRPGLGAGGTGSGATYEHLGGDALATISKQDIGLQGMKIDQMYFDRFADKMRADENVVSAVQAGEWDRAGEYIRTSVLDRPEEFFSLDRLRRSANVNRRLGMREILEVIFGIATTFKDRDELLGEEFGKFISQNVPPNVADVPAIKYYFFAYATDRSLRDIIDGGRYTDLATNPRFTTTHFKSVPENYRSSVAEYIKDYVSLNQFEL